MRFLSTIGEILVPDNAKWVAHYIKGSPRAHDGYGLGEAYINISCAELQRFSMVCHLLAC